MRRWRYFDMRVKFNGNYTSCAHVLNLIYLHDIIPSFLLKFSSLDILSVLVSVTCFTLVGDKK
jgi:hypothetical protein